MLVEVGARSLFLAGSSYHGDFYILGEEEEEYHSAFLLGLDNYNYQTFYQEVISDGFMHLFEHLDRVFFISIRNEELFSIRIYEELVGRKGEWRQSNQFEFDYFFFE